MTLGLKNSRELPFDLIDAGTNTLAKMTDAKIRPGALNGPGSPQSNMASQARRNSSHWPPRPIRTPPGPISKDWEKADVGITKNRRCRSDGECKSTHSLEHYKSSRLNAGESRLLRMFHLDVSFLGRRR